MSTNHREAPLEACRPVKMFALHCMAFACSAMLLAACSRVDGENPKKSVGPALAVPSATAQLGRKIFFDASLSGSGKMSCATCHSPQHAYGPPNDLPAQFGGRSLDVQGLRAAPSLRYVLNRTPRWFKQFQADPIERATETDSVPTGGFTRDGRFDTLRDQARAPLLAANEMANDSPAAVVDKLRAAPYEAEFRRVFGDQVFASTAQAFAKTLEALERFELEDPSFRPYTSRFDRYQQGQLQLTQQESRGLQLFADPQKGNCAACHIAAPGADGSRPLFSDFSFSAVGAPRNQKLAANANPKFFDLGLCGPVRTDQADRVAYCGMFKTPSLRNVAARGVFMHNGVFTNLTDVVRFYAERDTHPEKWYPKMPDGTLQRYNDLPGALRGNIDVIDAPLDRKASDQPALNDVEIKDIVAFLRTLSDDDVQDKSVK